MRTGAASAVRARRQNENDVRVTTAGLLCGDWRYLTTGCTALVFTEKQANKHGTKY